MDTADWIRAQHNGVCCRHSLVCMRGITSAMQRPIFPFPAREHRYLDPAMLLPSEPTSGGVVVSKIMSPARACS